MEKKQVIRLTEGDLHRIIEESVNNILNEISHQSTKDAYYNAYDSLIKKNKRGLKVSNEERKELERLYNDFYKDSVQNIDLNMPVQIVGGKRQGEYTVKDLYDNFEVKGHVEPFRNSVYKGSKLIGYPKIAGYLGPMWNGNGLRYETQEVFDMLSK